MFTFVKKNTGGYKIIASTLNVVDDIIMKNITQHFINF